MHLVAKLYRTCLLSWLCWLASTSAADSQEVAIHWRRVPLRDAIRRVEEVFDQRVFVDRRVDPSQRVSLDLKTSRPGDVIAQLATPRRLGVGQLAGITYLGPRDSAERLPALAALRAEEIERLPAHQAAALERRRPIEWPRLAAPRPIVTALIEERGWRIAEAQRIPHDLWSAGNLPAMTAAEQLTLLLIGFDLSFEVRPRNRTIEIVPIDARLAERLAKSAPSAVDDAYREVAPQVGRPPAETRQVYTLRVAEQPVRAVLEEFKKRLHWQIDIDEAALRAAGRSLDVRVSFTVTNVAQDELLDALLRPARLDFRREEERLLIVPREED